MFQLCGHMIYHDPAIKAASLPVVCLAGVNMYISKYLIAPKSWDRLYKILQTDDKDDNFCTGVMYVCAVDGCTNAECCLIHRFCRADFELASPIRSGFCFLLEAPAFGCQFSSSTLPTPSAPALDEGEWQSRVKRVKQMCWLVRDRHIQIQRERKRERKKEQQQQQQLA